MLDINIWPTYVIAIQTSRDGQFGIAMKLIKKPYYSTNFVYNL
jgi:hypothetical protein